MAYQETGRFGRITKQLRKLGFEDEMESILRDSVEFPKLKKSEQNAYLQTVVERMSSSIGEEDTRRVLHACGAQCCGKSWSKFARDIWNRSDSLDGFFANLNAEERKYNTTITLNRPTNTITVTRSQCICGLINKGPVFGNKMNYCLCSIGHMDAFFSTLFDVRDISMEETLYSGGSECRWQVRLGSLPEKI